MAEVKIILEVDDKGSVKIKQFGDESKKAFDEIQKGPKAAQGPLDSLKESWVGLTTKIAAATAVVYGVGKAFSSFVNKAAEAEQIENRLKFALETTGYTWQYAKSAVDEFANSLQATTRFSDEQARKALIDMMMYTKDFAKAQMGAKLAMDMSIRTGQDLGSTSRLIGMAMSGNVEMLGRYIPQLRNLDAVLGENATMAEKSAYAMKILNEKFGGTAQVDIDSYAGKLAQFKNAWSDFKEKIGNELLPPLKELLDTLKKITEEITKEPPYKEIPLAKLWGMEITRRVPLKGEELQEVLLQRQRLAAYNASQLAAERKPDVFVEDIKKREELIRSLNLGAAKTIAEAERLSDLGQMPSWLDSIEQIPKRAIPDINALTLETNKLIAEAERLSDLGQMPSWLDSIEQIPKRAIPDINALTLETNKLIAEAERLSDLGQMPDWREPLESIRKGFVAYKGRILPKERFENEVLEWKTITENLGRDISSAWSANMVNIVRSTESTSEKIKSFFQSIADVFLSAISKMIANWLIFGNLTGQSKEKGGGWGGVVGLVGSVVGGLLKHEGGIVGEPGPTRSVPAAAFAFAPRFHTGFMPGEYPAILKKGEGVFTPGQMKAMGGDTHTYYIDARGAQKGVSIEIMRAIKESENKAVIRSVNQVADSKLRGGKFAKIFKD